MKPILVLPVAIALLTSCTVVDLDKGKLFTIGDSQQLTMTHGQNMIYWAGMAHTPVWDAAGRFVGNVAAGVADMLIAHGVGHAVARGDANGVQLVTATIPSGIQKFTNRRTNRHTPAPGPSQRVLVTPQGRIIKPNTP